MIGSVPALRTDRIPPGRVLFVAEHDDTLRDNAQALAGILLNLRDTAAVGCDGGEAVCPWDITAVSDKVVGSTGMDGNILRYYQRYSK